MKRLLIFLLFISPVLYGQSELDIRGAAGLSKFSDGVRSIPQFSWYLSVSHRVNLKKSFYVGSSLLLRYINIKKKNSESLYCHQKISYDYYDKIKTIYAGFLLTIGWDIGPVWLDISSALTYPIQSKSKLDGLKKCVDGQITDVEKSWVNRSYKDNDFGIQVGLGYRFTDRMSAFIQFYHGVVYQYAVEAGGYNMHLVMGVKYTFKNSDYRYYKHE